jgi:hypothetical protein
MASSSPLLEDSEKNYSPRDSRESRSRVNRWTNLFYATVLGKDELTVRIEKVGNNQPGRPMDKQLNYLIQSVHETPYILDEILLKFSASINWQTSTISSCKIIMAIHEIIRNNRTRITKFDYCIIFLSELASFWKVHEHYFLERYAARVMNLSPLLKEYSVLSNVCFVTGVYYSARMRLNDFTAEEITTFISRLSNYQNSLVLGTIRQPGQMK